MMEIALRYQKTIVPVGCNGCDLVYTGSLPIGKKGNVVYRIGEPIPYGELSDFYSINWRKLFTSKMANMATMTFILGERLANSNPNLKKKNLTRIGFKA